MTTSKAVPPDYAVGVFINCPFDPEYQPLFRAILFTIQDAGFRARCALEAIDAGEVRLQKILNIIAACRYGVHDISRTEFDAVNHLPRFNMPFELGLDLGARNFGGKAHRTKVHLILDRERHRYQKYLSDIAGHDISAHNDDPAAVVREVRNWLRDRSGRPDIPGSTKIYERYRAFEAALPELCGALHLDAKELPFADLARLVFVWLQSNPLPVRGVELGLR